MSKAYEWNGYMIREDMVEALENYIRIGMPLGDFLGNIVENDFVHAAGRADIGNIHSLPAYAAYLYNKMPPGSWGSKEAVKAWIQRGGAEGET